MDKTTKAFVIGACSVVIALPVFWIGSQVINGIQQAHRRRRIEAVMAEQERQAKRFVPCSNRIFREGSRLLIEQYGLEMKFERDAWIQDCKKSTLPVDEFEG